MNRLIKNLNVIFDPNKKTANIGEILVGLGNTQGENKGLVLQHKTAKKRYASLSQYVDNLDLGNTNQEYHTLFIEDLSVDTVLSIWIALSKLHQHHLPAHMSVWLDYASRWERGDTSTTGKPFHSYGCLQNALVLNANGKSLKERLSDSLFFLDQLIKHSIDPANISPILDLKLYERAKNNLLIEYEKYDNLVRSNEVVALYVPQLGADGCRRISGIFIETDIISSIQKVFLRNDEKSPTKDGYALMAVYNANAKGTGNDIVISVDPVKEIYLKDLWQALEKEEDKLWNGMRPKDNPRMLSSYPNNNGPNEPWWDDMGNYTLIAAPKMLGSEYGRRVSWKTVKQLIKQLYAKGMKNDRT